MLELYYKNISPPSRAVYATIKHLGLSVKIRPINTFEESSTEEFLKLNPAHQVPLLIDDDMILGESRAIICYLINQYSPNHPIYPANAKARAKIDRILYFDGTNLYPAIKEMLMGLVRKAKPTEEQLGNIRNALEELLALKGSNKFMAGSDISLADISLAMVYSVIERFLPEESAKLSAWYAIVEATIPAVKEINDTVDFSPFLEFLNE